MAIRTTLWNSRLTLPALGCLGWVGLVGCKPVDPADSPFKARKVEAASAAALPTTGPDPRFEEKDRLSLTSEQLASGAVGSLISGGPAPKEAANPAGTSGGPAPESNPNAGTPAAPNGTGPTPSSGVQAPGVLPAGVVVSTSLPANVGAVPAGNGLNGGNPAPAAGTSPAAGGAGTLGAWPIRLVRTLPETNPPRAILGLPSGEELVVWPGKMLPDQGLVVMSVGRERIQVAKIAANGDHAAVSEMTLTALY
jgi:hypothetical protein